VKTIKQKIQEIPRNQLEEFMERVVEALYPNQDPDFEWSPDTLDEIANIVEGHNLDSRDLDSPKSSVDPENLGNLFRPW